MTKEQYVALTGATVSYQNGRKVEAGKVLAYGKGSKGWNVLLIQHENGNQEVHPDRLIANLDTDQFFPFGA
jgi:hypothetical protein